jgi:hypothetical protein
VVGSPRVFLLVAVAVIAFAAGGFALGHAKRSDGPLRPLSLRPITVHVSAIENTGSVPPLCVSGSAC